MKNLLTILFMLIGMQGCKEPEPKQSFAICWDKNFKTDSISAFYMSPLITAKELKDRYGITIKKIHK